MPGRTGISNDEVVPEGVIGADEREPGLANKACSRQVVGRQKREDAEEEVGGKATGSTPLFLL